MEFAVRISFVIGLATLMAGGKPKLVDDGAKQSDIVVDQQRWVNGTSGSQAGKPMSYPDLLRRVLARTHNSIDSETLIGQWDGWIGSPLSPGSMQRCQAFISKASDGALTARIMDKPLGMTVSGRQETAGLANFTRSLVSGSVTVKVNHNGHLESVTFSQSKTGNVLYLTGSSISGAKYQFWKTTSGSSMMHASWH